MFHDLESNFTLIKINLWLIFWNHSLVCSSKYYLFSLNCLSLVIYKWGGRWLIAGFWLLQNRKIPLAFIYQAVLSHSFSLPIMAEGQAGLKQFCSLAGSLPGERLNRWWISLQWDDCTVGKQDLAQTAPDCWAFIGMQMALSWCPGMPCKRHSASDKMLFGLKLAA